MKYEFRPSWYTQDDLCRDRGGGGVIERHANFLVFLPKNSLLHFFITQLITVDI